MSKKMVPELRFPEFAGDWEACKLASAFDVIDGDRGKNYPKVDDFSLHGDCVFLSAKNVTKYGFCFDNVSFISNEKDEAMSKGKLSIGDLILTTRGSIGYFAIFNSEVPFENLRINSGMVVLRQKNTSIVGNYLYLLTNTYGIKKQIEVLSFGSAQPQLTVKCIQGIVCNYPSIKEQKKIATFITAIDKKIDIISQKKEQMELYKKGMMQKLFSQEIRFKDDDGNNYPDWEEKWLGELCFIGNGKDYKHLKSGDIPVFGTGGYMCSVSEKLGDGETVFIGRKGTINKPFYYEGSFWTVDTLFYTHKFNGVMPFFLFLIFQQVNWKKYNEASGVPSLSKKTISKISVNHPSICEQSRIVSFFKAIDQKIESIAKEKSQLATFKKGLLQKMFV